MHYITFLQLSLVLFFLSVLGTRGKCYFGWGSSKTNDGKWKNIFETIAFLEENFKMKFLCVVLRPIFGFHNFIYERVKTVIKTDLVLGVNTCYHSFSVVTHPQRG